MTDPFVRYPDPRLTQKASPEGSVTPALIGFGERLLEAARAVSAHGLAAAHIGEVAPVVVVASGQAAPDDYLILYCPDCPAVTAVASETESAEEGSVALPDVRVQVIRPVWAEIAYLDGAGTRREVRLEGFAARVALHEIDQMNGVFFLERVSRLKRDMALKKARKQRQGSN